MVRFNHFILTAISVFTLVACGGSSGGHSEPQQVNKAAADKTETVVQPTQSESSEVVAPVPKDTATLQGDNSRMDLSEPEKELVGGMSRTVFGRKSYLEQLSLEGKNLALVPLDVEVRNKMEGVSDYVMCCNDFKTLRFGLAESKHNAFYLLDGFYNGYESSSLPEGLVSYKGKAFVVGDHKQFGDQPVVRGNAEFQVDFGAKTLNGKIVTAVLEPIEITATLSGAYFDGIAHTPSFDREKFSYHEDRDRDLKNAKVHGIFSGEQASEMGGAFHNGSRGVHEMMWGGSFGAKKQ